MTDTDDNRSPSIKRRLAAILAADIAGYSALMGVDEARTVQDLKAHQAVVLPMIGQHSGRIITKRCRVSLCTFVYRGSLPV